MGVEIGALHVRRCAFVDALPARVWQEFTSAERLAAWFGTGHRLESFEPKVGGTIEFSVTPDGRPERFGGRVVAFDEAGELSFENNWKSADRAWPVATLITIRLTSLYAGTLVELFHHGFERLGADAASQLEGYEAGWDSHHLEALRAIVEG